MHTPPPLTPPERATWPGRHEEPGTLAANLCSFGRGPKASGSFWQWRPRALRFYSVAAVPTCHRRQAKLAAVCSSRGPTTRALPRDQCVNTPNPQGGRPVQQRLAQPASESVLQVRGRAGTRCAVLGLAVGGNTVHATWTCSRAGMTQNWEFDSQSPTRLLTRRGAWRAVSAVLLNTC